MSERPVETSRLDPHIVIEPVGRLVRVHLAGYTLAETRSALILREAGKDARIYIPRSDVDVTMLQVSGHRTDAPATGPCVFFHLPDGGERSDNGAWSYESPPPSLTPIQGHVAFDPKCVDWIQIET